MYANGLKKSKSVPYFQLPEIPLKYINGDRKYSLDENDIVYDSDYSSDGDETLFIYNKNNTVVLFESSNDINKIKNCLILRNDIDAKVRPLEYNEYFDNNNKYFICSSYNSDTNKTYIIGYILYNIDFTKNIINILDIIFRSSSDKCNIDTVDITHAKKKCVNAFADYVKQTNYYCAWRSNILHPITYKLDKSMNNKYIN